MVAELVTGLGLFKTALDSAKGLKDINDATIRNETAIKLQETILAAQAQQISLIAKVGDLETQVAGFEKWEAEKKRYHLYQVAPGRFCYLLKRAEANGEPCHALCASCYDQGKKSTLQSNGNPFNDKHALVCPSCKLSLQIPPNQIPDYAG